MLTGQEQGACDDEYQDKKDGGRLHPVPQRNAGFACTYGGIQFFRPLHVFSVRAGSDGLVPDHLTVLGYGRNVGTDPIVVTVLAPIFYQTHPGLAGFQMGPHVFVGGRRHIRMPDDVVGLADQLITSETTHLDKRRVTVANLPFQISGRNQFLVRREGFLVIRDR